ncbi:hypothetical protein GDO81_030201 [Engystomops pustulosus]|uniref:MHC class I antigen n=1 Tax=Engystomops pustulosus TaxID=76066 RepID=A0AAV6YCN3_ENGPU|nr:hypothetical protein GDO81_030201 [Engystomops pustulosus]
MRYCRASHRAEDEMHKADSDQGIGWTKQSMGEDRGPVTDWVGLGGAVQIPGETGHVVQWASGLYARRMDDEGAIC